MSLRSSIATAALLTLLGTSCGWAEPLGVATAFDGAYRVDLGNRQATELGLTGQYASQLIAVEGMAYAPDGRLFAVSDNLKALFRIDPNSGAATFVGPLGLSGEGQYSNLDTAFAITADGKAWLASAVVSRLWSVDLNIGLATPVGDTNVKISGLAARGNELFAAGSRGDEGLYRVNTHSGQATLIGSFKQAVPYAPTISIGFDTQDRLWGVINYNPPLSDGNFVNWSDVALIDPDRGTIALQGPLTGPASLKSISVRGLALSLPHATAVDAEVVPAGGPLAALALGLGLALIARRRLGRPLH